MRPQRAKLSAIIVFFLRRHPDEALCGRCLAGKLTGRPQVTSSAICRAEGLGVRRAYGQCSACGQNRLVAAASGA